MNKYIRAIVIILSLVIITWVVALLLKPSKNNESQQVGNNNQQSMQGITATTAAGGTIIIDNLVQGQTVQLPMTVTGVVAKWFFEGSFPVFMKDSNGNQIGVGLASSSQDWMTANPIPFSVTLPAVNYTGQGTLVFTKDNPSGEPQFNDSYTVNVSFQ